jgi:hypothetical protein
MYVITPMLHCVHKVVNERKDENGTPAHHTQNEGSTFIAKDETLNDRNDHSVAQRRKPKMTMEAAVHGITYYITSFGVFSP